MTAGRRKLGRWGEARAEAWYTSRGWQVLDRNWRCRAGEIDLVLRRGDTIVFCEVKTRSSAAYGTAAEAVDGRKQRRLRRLAVEWLSRSPERAPDLRFDVACVQQGKVEVLEGAF